MKAFPDLHLTNEKIHTNGEFFEAVSFSGKHQAGLQAVIKAMWTLCLFPTRLWQANLKTARR